MSSEFSMFIKSIKRNYLKVLADESIPDGEKIDALLMKLGGEFLVSKDDRVYIFEKDGVTARFDACYRLLKQYFLCFVYTRRMSVNGFNHCKDTCSGQAKR